MTPPSSYRFAAVPADSLFPSDREDPFRFYHNQEPMPVTAPVPRPRLLVEVVDADQNRQLNERDEFFYLNQADGRRLKLPSDLGLRILNYYTDPTVLSSQNLGMVIHAEDLPSSRMDGLAGLSDVVDIPPAERDQITDRHFPFWEYDGHLDMDILEGLRVYTAEENNRWTGWRGIGNRFSWGYLLRRGLLEKGGVASIFMAGEHFINPTFMWTMYTTNFSSMVGGSIINNSRLEGSIDSRYGLGREDAGHSLRRIANIQTAGERARISEDHLYFTLTWPVVIGACFFDPNFRKFWPAPWRLPRPGILYNHFAGQFRTALPSLGRGPLAWLKNPMGLGLALAAGFGIYEVTSAWFDIYGGLRKGTTENRIFSGASTILTETWLLSKASREMRALTGSGALNWANFRALAAARPQLGFVATLPEGGALTRAWQASPRVQTLFQRPYLPTVEVEAVAAHNPLGRLFNRVGLPRLGIEARVPFPSAALPSLPLGAANDVIPAATVETTMAGERAALLETAAVRQAAAGENLLAQAAMLVPGRSALPAAEEALALTEAAAMTGTRTRLVGLPLLAFAAGIGIAFGLCYATGMFDTRYGPRDLVRDSTGR
jgi:hypothetical protein